MRLIKGLLTLLIPLLILTAGVELSLRILPQVIPLPLLQHFQPDLRQRIAEDRGLPTTRAAMTVERDDGGPLLRKFRPETEVNWTFYDEGAIESIVTDDMGFCNPPAASYDRVPIDVIAIGDSFTWCHTVPPATSWPAVLSGLSGRSVYNLGTPAIGLYEYLVILRRFGLSRQPQVVVMNVYEGNDLRDAMRYWAYRNGRQHVAAERDCSGLLCRALGERSYVYNLAVAVNIEYLQPLFAASGPAVDAAFEAVDTDDLSFYYSLDFGGEPVPFNLRNADRDEIAVAKAMAQGALSPTLFDEALEEFVSLAAEHGFVPVVAYTPSAHTAYADYVRFDDPDLAPLMAGMSTTLRDYFSASGERLGYFFLDLTGPLREVIAAQGPERAQRLLYGPVSIHYSVHGHRRVAEAVADFLGELPVSKEPDGP
ncbi:MAG: hypothetical protein PVG91_03505 [Gammaproteobacteria bacterium]|jgi:hypothetical protein